MKKIGLLSLFIVALLCTYGLVLMNCNTGGDSTTAAPYSSEGKEDIPADDDSGGDDDSGDDDTADDDATDDDDTADDDTADDDATDDDATDDDTTDDDDDFADCPGGFPSAPNCDDTVVRGSLEWTMCDNGEYKATKDINYYCATHYAEQLVLDEKEDWRLPSRTELAELYDTNNEYWVECGSYWVDIADPFIICCYQVWTNQEQSSSTAYYYNFMFGEESFAQKGDSQEFRALAVRAVSKE